MLKKIRILLALIFLLGVTLLFLDFTGLAAAWLGWMARLQFLPALLAGNFIIVVVLVAITLLLGRVYCSVICPLGVMQDGFAALGRKTKRNRYSFSPAKRIMRYTFLGLMVVALIAGVGAIFTLIAPYSAYGRIASNLFQPLWLWGNNMLARWAEAHDSYQFYTVDIWVKSIASIVIAAATLILVSILAWRNGRSWCNTVCPVGTVLGWLAQFSLLKPVIDTSKCISCFKCERNCKSACIDIKNKDIDYSRCVTCYDCISVCPKGAISYTRRHKVSKVSPAVSAAPQAPVVEDKGRRDFLTVTAVAATAAVADAQIKMDGGLAVIEDKKIPKRLTPLTPPGSLGHQHLSRHCTGCQLCIAECPNNVLRPSTNPAHLLQPEMQYDRGYCRPECTRCGEVCPAGAIHKITTAQKSTISIGHAIWVRDNCIVVADGHKCGNCERHCPSGAITMVPLDSADPQGKLRIPVVDAEKCLGCGACEYVCPARPFSAIYVDGNDRHHEI